MELQSPHNGTQPQFRFCNERRGDCPCAVDAPQEEMSMTRSNPRIAREVARIVQASAFLAAFAVPLHAQENNEEITTVVVTGSNIARTEQGALPVQSITQE